MRWPATQVQDGGRWRDRPGAGHWRAGGLIMALVVAGSASAHAYLIKTMPAASGVLNGPPPSVALTYDEAVEPGFAIVSGTNAEGRQQTAGSVRRSRADPDTLVVALRPHLPEGWYLVYWLAISVDGHAAHASLARIFCHSAERRRPAQFSHGDHPACQSPRAPGYVDPPREFRSIRPHSLATSSPLSASDQ
ncbi:MAG: copper resistance CopC family protein [Solirubrobacteraceae bacterium]